MSIEIGTAETIVENKKLNKRSNLTTGEGSKGSGKRRGGGGGGGGDDNGGNNGGDSNPKNRNFENLEEQFKPDKLRIVMWFLLLVVLMTFSGLIATYVVIATNGVPEWQPFNLPFQLWLSTVLILVSSITYQFSSVRLQNDDQESAKKWLLATTVLGATFISSQIMAWSWLAYRGVYLRGNPYAGFFYILTAIHAAHVLGGILTLGYMVLRSWRKTNLETELLRRKTISKVVGWYWHFMGALWLVLFGLLGFWK